MLAAPPPSPPPPPGVHQVPVALQDELPRRRLLPHPQPLRRGRRRGQPGRVHQRAHPPHALIRSAPGFRVWGERRSAAGAPLHVRFVRRSKLGRFGHGRGCDLWLVVFARCTCLCMCVRARAPS
eukprot:scaffold12808_cov133-Isochrysis_galbana.AAC.4